MEHQEIDEVLGDSVIVSSLERFAYSNDREPEWQGQAIQKVAQIIEPLWEKMNSALSGCMCIESMKPQVRSVWEDFRAGTIDAASVRIRLEIVRPLAKR